MFNISPFSANFTKWSNTLKQFVGNLPTDCVSVFDRFVGLVLKGLMAPIDITNDQRLNLQIKDENICQSYTRNFIICHYMKSVRIWSFSGPIFLAFGLNREKYGISLRIQS